MKIWTLAYGVGFLIFMILTAVIVVQNGGENATFSFLWMKISLFALLGIAVLFGILQGIFLILLIRSFFTGMQRPELTKFDLDKPL